jgi:predicted DNA-binding transcriptional regulator YafY
MGTKWNKDTGPGEKLLRLFALLLFTQESYSLGQLAKMLLCSKQTVLRLIDQLEASNWGKVLREDAGKKALFRIERPPQLPQISLNPDGLAQLALCRNFLENLLPASLRSDVDIALQQVCAYVPPSAVEHISALGKISGACSKGGIDYSQKYPILQTLLQAAIAKKVCEITYKASAQKEARTFDFAPLRLFAHNNSIYAAGWEVTDRGSVLPLHNDPSIFLVHRFIGAIPTRRTWKDLPNPENEPSAFGIMQGEPFSMRVRVTTPEAVTYVAERSWSADQKITLNEDGSLILTMTAQSAPEVASWALSLGSAAEVLEPGWLREQIKKEVAELSALYGHKTQ